ncbi:MAG TPA: FecR domain-containing protein [Bryobacteraceae bacterium]|nr:FecR domain-containing protein [Bryobacteraceae bacterium]
MPDEKPPLGPIEPGQLPLVKAPEAIWRSIEAALDAKPEPRRTLLFPAWQWAAASLLVMSGIAWYATRPELPGWQVSRLEGSGAVDKIKVGEWLQTDGNSRARITVGNIGVVDVEPNTRVRLVAASPTEHRLTLARGEISATVTAPPRLFLVDTPASTAVDLGCAYKIKTDASGDGVLRVTSGWVSLEWKGRESLVPAGANCRTRAGTGPGTPYFEDAPEALQQALAAFDFGKGGEESLRTILGQARVRDTLSLWHVLSRVEPRDRVRVLDRMVELVPLPAGVAREKALQLDPATLKSWREELAWKW